MKKLFLNISFILLCFIANGQSLDVKFNINIEVVPASRLALITLSKTENVDSIFLGILTDDSFTEEEGDYSGIPLFKLKKTPDTQTISLSEVLRSDGIDSFYTLHPIVYFNNIIQDPRKISSSFGEGPAEVYPLCFTEDMLASFKRKKFTIKAKR